MNYFTADTHFFHQDILGMDNFAPRPFKSIDEMNQTIIENWNARVQPTDVVYHLGDIALYFIKPAKEAYRQILAILNQLNGNLILIKGNHDSREFFKYLAKHNFMVNGKPKFQFQDVGALIKFNHRQYYLTHYPMMLGIVHQIINLHGHIHHYSVPIKENINVGIDSPELDYLDDKLPFGTPLSEEEIETIIDRKAIDLAKRG
ncbi:metallophosphoesterase [Lactobacillus sp. Sy-1]|uniref:metallophosphoesterase n=1 Tax=Lactobacillus sp. Sy-1 TaxID=2109645 RepID=UPI001C588F02|nr:metallophosphoesterase [Lactobacillus sp. Sy-1]MBW1605758.1 metallophosphoesterase [Lactobacillus sp. Sy-1]